MIKNFLLVGMGGMVGSMLRYAVSLVFNKYTLFPWATFIVNIIGCFVIGLMLGAAPKYITFSSPHWKLLLTTGLCGGFTTFSAFSVEGVHLLQEQHYAPFLLYFAVSIVLGLGAVWLGMLLTK